MTGEALSIILDIVVMAGLVATIYFCLKLSRSLNNFRNNRAEFDSMIETLNQNIEHAYEALTALREESARSGGDIKKQIDEARRLSRELQDVNALTDRLEEGAKAKTHKSEEIEQDLDFDQQLYNYIETSERVNSALDEEPEQPDIPSFYIQDRDFDEASDLPPEQDFQSQAERELFEALQRNKKRSG